MPTYILRLIVTDNVSHQLLITTHSNHEIYYNESSPRGHLIAKCLSLYYITNSYLEGKI